MESWDPSFDRLRTSGWGGGDYRIVSMRWMTTRGLDSRLRGNDGCGAEMTVGRSEGDDGMGMTVAWGEGADSLGDLAIRPSTGSGPTVGVLGVAVWVSGARCSSFDRLGTGGVGVGSSGVGVGMVVWVIVATLQWSCPGDQGLFKVSSSVVGEEKSSLPRKRESRGIGSGGAGFPPARE